MSPPKPADLDRTRTVGGPNLAAPEAPKAQSTDHVVATGAGKHLGRFELKERVGEGGMGVVYRATDKMLSRDVAIKVLNASSSSPERRLRMQREAQAMAALSHPNLVTVYDAGVDGDEVFIAMEYVHGTTLSGWLDREPRSWLDIRTLFMAAGRGLEAAHAAGIIHRDFKPSNVLVGNDGSVQVADFGIALADSDAALAHGEEQDSEAVQLTKTGVALGTPKYMSPEQHQAKRVDARSDQFSFALSLAEAAYGEHPFTTDSYRALVHSVLDDEPTFGPHGPAGLDAILRRALARDSADRYPSMTALLTDLAELRGARQWPWIVVGLAAMCAIALASAMLGNSSGAYMKSGGITTMPSQITRSPAIAPVPASSRVAAVSRPQSKDASAVSEPTTQTNDAGAGADAGAVSKTKTRTKTKTKTKTKDATVVSRRAMPRRPRHRSIKRAPVASRADAGTATPPVLTAPAPRIGRMVYRNKRCALRHDTKTCDHCCGEPGQLYNTNLLMPYPNCGCYYDALAFAARENRRQYRDAKVPTRTTHGWLRRRCGLRAKTPRTCSNCCTQPGDKSTPFPACGCYNSKERTGPPPRRIGDWLYRGRRCRRYHSEKSCGNCCDGVHKQMPYPNCGCYINSLPRRMRK